MFACLEINQKENRWHKPAPPALIRVTPPGGAPFFRIETARRRGELPWREIERAAGRLRTKMLFPQGVEPPPCPPAKSAAQAQLEPGLRAYVPKRLPLLLCMRAAEQVLRASNAPAQVLRVTVADSRGLLTRSLEPLVPLAGSLRVFTPDVSLYRNAAAQLLHRYGITLILSDSPGCFAQSHVVIADDLSLFKGHEPGLIFTSDLITPLPQCRVIRLQGPTLPEAFETLRPAAIDPLHFAGALYELCGVKEMERLNYREFHFDGVTQAYSIQDLAEMLRSACSESVARLSAFS